MRRNRAVKIVATVGPACSTRDMLRALFVAGVDVFRLNMSHGTHADIAERHKTIREIEHEMERPIGILADLQGPKLRVGKFAAGPQTLVPGATFRFDLDDTPGDGARVHLPHPEIFAALRPGATLLVNDGKIRLAVQSCDASHAVCEVVIGGEISNNKGVNVPDVVLPLAALTPKDRRDLDYVLTLGIDWLALSFVQRPEDVIEAREIAGSRAAIMVKIEKPAAVARFSEILAVADGVMVARGDLGVEMDISELPPIQKRLIRDCRRAAKPVIVATQMLESMITSPVPTRAEVSDVATAIYDGADAVMLSAESAAGAYPVEAVAMMNAIALNVEGEELYREGIVLGRAAIQRDTVADAITAAARQVAEATQVKAICCFTHSGTTALLAARERPAVPILALTPVVETARRLSLAWGLHCVISPSVDRFKLAVINAVRAVLRDGFATPTDNIIVTAGVPFNMPGTTNILRVAPVDEKKIFEGGHE